MGGKAEDHWVTQAELGKHLDLSQPSVSNLVKSAIIEPQARGRYDLDECRIAYIRHLRASASGRQGGSGPLSLEGERARLAKEQADAKAMENQVTRGELVKAADVSVAWEQIGTEVKRVLLSIPSDLAPLLEGTMSTAKREALLRDRIEEALEALTGMRVDAEQEDGAGG